MSGSNKWFYVRQLLVDKNQKNWTGRRTATKLHRWVLGYTPHQEPATPDALREVKAVGSLSQPQQIPGVDPRTRGAELAKWLYVGNFVE